MRISRIFVVSPRRERAATATEYALIVSGIAMALVLATFALGDTLAMSLRDMATFLR